MTEFNNREKTIILITTYINHPVVKQIPEETLVFGLHAMLVAKNIPVNETELKDMIQAVKQEQSNSIQEGFGYLSKMQK